MAIRLGELMVKRGLLTNEQVRAIVDEQRHCSRPFGELAERMFGVNPRDVEGAWVEQYASIAGSIDPRSLDIDHELVEIFSRRQAWQFGVLPVRRDDDGLVVCTTGRHLARAVRFVYQVLRMPTAFVLAEPLALGEAINAHYPMTGMSPDRLLGGDAAPPWRLDQFRGVACAASAPTI